MEVVELILRWEVIVGAAVLGAVISVIGSIMIARGKDGAGTGRSLLRAGYAITFFSIALFVVAGFMAEG